MGKRAYIVLAVLAVALVGVFVWRVRQPREPVYEGKPLSEWLKAYESPEYMYARYATDANRRAFLGAAARGKADEAVRHAGTNAIPTLLRLLRAKDSALKVKLTDLLHRQHFIKVRPFSFSADEWQFAAFCGFQALGTNAQAAVPELIEIANQNVSATSRYCDSAFEVLYGFTGLPPREAVPALLRWATNSNPYFRIYARQRLPLIDPEAAAKAGITNAP
jgi:hypothetical protein